MWSVSVYRELFVRLVFCPELQLVRVVGKNIGLSKLSPD
jgi:hypothetical protein